MRFGKLAVIEQILLGRKRAHAVAEQNHGKPGLTGACDAGERHHVRQQRDPSSRAEVSKRSRIPRRSPVPATVVGIDFKPGGGQKCRYIVIIAGAGLAGSVALDNLKIDPSRAADLTVFNHEFEPARTPYDWLSRDPVAVDAYVSDRLCGFAPKAASAQKLCRCRVAPRRSHRGRAYSFECAHLHSGG